MFVVIDLLLVPQIDFAVARLIFSLSAVFVLIFGFVWSTGGQS